MSKATTDCVCVCVVTSPVTGQDVWMGIKSANYALINNSIVWKTNNGSISEQRCMSHGRSESIQTTESESHGTEKWRLPPSPTFQFDCMAGFFFVFYERDTKVCLFFKALNIWKLFLWVQKLLQSYFQASLQKPFQNKTLIFRWDDVNSTFFFWTISQILRQ